MLLSSALDKIRFEFEDSVRNDFGKKMYRIKPDDSMRLLKLRVWSVRYKVSVRYILLKLVPHFERFARAYRRNSSDGLGVTIAVLTGNAAEEKLRECIAKDFPDGENTVAWKEAAKARCIAIMDKDEIMGRPKPFLHHKTIDAFMDSYKTRISQMQREQEKLDKKMSKQPWRDNPWR